VQLVHVLTRCVTDRLSDRIGRSIMLALGFPNMAWSMLVFAFLFKITDPSVQVPMVSIFAVVFVLFYSPTAGTSPFVSTQKVDRQRTRLTQH
jgi:nitrate/nitrite transporter NarK